MIQVEKGSIPRVIKNLWLLESNNLLESDSLSPFVKKVQFFESSHGNPVQFFESNFGNPVQFFESHWKGFRSVYSFEKMTNIEKEGSILGVIMRKGFH